MLGASLASTARNSGFISILNGEERGYCAKKDAHKAEYFRPRQRSRFWRPTYPIVRAILCIMFIAIVYWTMPHVVAIRRGRDIPSAAANLDDTITTSSDRYDAIDNTTLGFGKIFVVNMPARSDKLDAFSLAASFTSFVFEIIPGVMGRDVNKKSLPAIWPGLDGPGAMPSAAGALGCWRAHLNFARRMVMENLQSALIFEDDADWDWHLRDQLKTFALGSQLLSDQTNQSTISPYGDDWDILWLGHCASSPKPDDPRRFLIRNDKTVPDVVHRKSLWGPDNELKKYGEQVRMVYEADTGTCTYAYALSLRGARKVLHRLSLGDVALPIDQGLDNLCRNRGEDFDFRCIAPYPTLVDSRRYSESNDNPDSDIQGPAMEFDGGKRGAAFTRNIQYSIRHNAPRLVAGESIESQWSNEENLDEEEVDLDAPRSNDSVYDDIELELVLAELPEESNERPIPATEQSRFAPPISHDVNAPPILVPPAGANAGPNAAAGSAAGAGIPAVLPGQAPGALSPIPPELNAPANIPPNLLPPNPNPDPLPPPAMSPQDLTAMGTGGAPQPPPLPLPPSPPNAAPGPVGAPPLMPGTIPPPPAVIPPVSPQGAIPPAMPGPGGPAVGPAGLVKR